MAKPAALKNFPDCDLLKVLLKKASKRKDTEFNFIGRLDEFRQHVLAEVSQINQLFPEYTPHDEKHLKKLFHVADRVLESNRLKKMNSAELLVLAVALYGHDWGMAVSDNEKDYIRTGKLPKGTNAEDYAILPNESKNRFAKFVKKQQLEADSDGNVKEIAPEMWREYLRQTHADRSGQRVRKFFKNISGSVANAAAKVCVGHWLDFEDLQDHEAYPVDASVLDETVNLRALTVYLRLIDLLDMTEDRTPYVLWKYIAPKDTFSNMEWEKHRAIHEVTFPEYLEGRIIRVEGSTESNEVYAELEDFRISCEKQLKGCMNILARMHDDRHMLDFHNVTWHIDPINFEPVSIQFEFDRDRMFEILSDEIYQGDPYVFLRELLQNSIDAIRMRRRVLEKRGVLPANFGEIHVTVDHQKKGDATITWRDNGIGMNDDIVRNYLALAGKSYYQSADFEREGIDIDPISRFGVGILSCFMVAGKIEIETYRDTYLSPESKPLKVSIPDVSKQFRIEFLPPETIEFGTTVRVHVDGKRLPKDKEDEPVKSLDVSQYLSIVAGFVEFPIVITEGERKTIILHPKQDEEAARERFGEEYETHQLNMDYPWDKVVVPQDLSTAKEILQEMKFDLSLDLDLEEYEGVLSYLMPISEETDILRHEDGGISYISRGMEESIGGQTRWKSTWQDEGRHFPVFGLSASCKRHKRFAVYRDGIFLSTVSQPEQIEHHHSNFLPRPMLIINIPKSKASKTDLARTQILGSSKNWDSAAFQALLQHLEKEHFSALFELDPAERIYQIARMVVKYGIHPERIWENFAQELWPLPFLSAEKGIIALEWQEVSKREIFLLPELLSRFVFEICYSKWLTQAEYSGPLSLWNGEPCLITRMETSKNQTMREIISCGDIPFVKEKRTTSIRFISPPWKGDPPLIQKTECQIVLSNAFSDSRTMLESIAANAAKVGLVDIHQLRRMIAYPEIIHYFAYRLFEFPAPFHSYFAFGNQAFNCRHSIVQEMLRVLARFELSCINEDMSLDKIGRFKDAYRTAIGPYYSEGGDYESFSTLLIGFWSIARELDLLGGDSIENLIPSPEVFVPGTFGVSYEDLALKMLETENPHPFGELIT